MTRRTRLWLSLVAGAGVTALLAWGLSGLPDFGSELGPYARLIADTALAERHATNIVVSVAFDYRAFDTLGEEFILFAAATGTTVLLRTQRDEQVEGRVAEVEQRRGPDTSDVLRALGAVLVGPTIVLGAYIVAHGHLTPGGGFQGGLILAAALLLVFVAGQEFATRRVRPLPLMELADAVGAAGFALVALGGLVFAGVFFANFLPLGAEGDLLSGGMIPVGNVAVGVEVVGAFALVLTEFLDQAVIKRRGGA